MGKTIISVLRENYINYPDRVFCRLVKGDKLENITYKILVENSFSYTAHYRNASLKEGDTVIIILKHSPELIYSFIGAILGSYVPSILPFPSEKQDINLYRKSLEELSRLIRAKSILTYKENLVEMERIGKEHGMDVFTPDDVNSSPEKIWIEADERCIAFLQHSSGTTGLKKGVALSHLSVINQIENYSKEIKLAEGDKIVSWLPLYHDMGLIACFIMPLLKRTQVVMMDPFEWVVNPSMIFREIELNKSTLCWLPNFAYNFMANCIDTDSQKYNLSTMRAFIDCSEPCKRHSFEMFYVKFKEWGVKKNSLQTCYAMAENVFAITQSPIGKEVNTDCVKKESFAERHFAEKTEVKEGSMEFLSVGRCIQNTKIKIVDNSRKEVGERLVGEIAVSSDSLFSGYYRLDEESKKFIEDGWFYTGDMGYIADGELYITGRKKDLIIVHGKNYYAHDIEYIVNNVEGVKRGRCVAAGMYNDAVGSEEAVVIAESGLEDAESKRRLAYSIKLQVSKALNLTLGDVHIVPLKWIVKTTSGKISRSENLKKYIKEKCEVQ